ncbi:MAG: ATP-grasp domain-containing protein [Methylophagaceae bacterium]
MQDQRKPILILAQSGRLLAQSATHADYPVWVADCFGDQDTLSIVDRWLKVPTLVNSNHDTLVQILSELSQGENCSLICGSGIESCYTLLDSLPKNIQLIGNSAQTIHTIKTPPLFFSLLDKLELSYPDTQFERPKNDDAWLMKAPSGLGGSHIQKLHSSSQITDHYFQKYIEGGSGSVLFLANGQNAQLISLNRQLIADNKESSFRLVAIEMPWNIAHAHQYYLKQAISKISKASGLVGLNSLDFMISDQDECLILEINPRPSASVELIDNDENLFQYHINACQGILPIQPLNTATTHKISLRYLFAEMDYLIPDDMNWPIECHDLPATGTIISTNEPICTSIVKSGYESSIEILHNDIEHKVLQQLISS